MPDNREIDLEKGIPQARPRDDNKNESAVVEDIKTNKSDSQTTSLETTQCVSIWSVLGFLLGMLTVPISIVILVSLFILPVPERIRQYRFIRAASCGALIGFLTAIVIVIVLRSLENRNGYS